MESAELANACVKRAAAAADADFGARRKRMRNGGGSEEEMRRIAEIVLVLSGMGAMRGGREPTLSEKAMMAEARAMAVAVCEGLPPREIVPREAFAAIIEDLGLNRLKEQRLGFRPPRLSIVEKMESSEKKMEESDSFAAQAAADSCQRAQAGVENHGMSTGVRPFSSDRTSHMHAPAGTFQHTSQTSHVSSASSTVLYFQPASTQVRAPMVSTGPKNSNLVRDSSSTASGVNIPHVGSGGRVNVPSKAPHVPTALQSRSFPSSNISTKNKPPQYSVTIEGHSPIYSQVTNVQTISSAFAQVVPGTLPSPHHPIQGTQIVNAAHHLEISKIIQKLLHPKQAEPPTWSPPSRHYMNKPVACQMCKLAINEVDNMFVCDVCEKGFHSKCLQSTNQKFVPRGEWYCPRCTTISGGKPFPPKYGRVTRNSVATNITSSSAGLQSPPENRVEAHDQYASQQKKMAEGEPDERKGPQVGALVDASSEAKAMQADKMHNGELSAGIKKDEIPSSETCPNKNPAPAGTLENQPTLHVERPEAPLREDKVQEEAKDCTSAYSSIFDASKDRHPSTSHSIVHGTETISTTPSTEQHKDDSLVDNNLEQSNGTKTDDGKPISNFKQDDPDAGHEKQIETAGVGSELQDTAKGSKGLHCVDWIGDAHEAVEDKKFYQSCQINGVIYKLLDYALIRSSSGKLMPWKIQAMWEDVQTGSRWVDVNRCYFPGDLPATVGHPSAPEGNEVYESNDESTLMAGLIEGPCIIVPAKKFGETDQRGNQQSDGGRPSFSCRWFYDKIRGVFRPVPS